MYCMQGRIGCSLWESASQQQFFVCILASIFIRQFTSVLFNSYFHPTMQKRQSFSLLVLCVAYHHLTWDFAAKIDCVSACGRPLQLIELWNRLPQRGPVMPGFPQVRKKVRKNETLKSQEKFSKFLYGPWNFEIHLKVRKNGVDINMKASF